MNTAKHDAHVQLYYNWYRCHYRTLPYWKTACSVCQYLINCTDEMRARWK